MNTEPDPKWREKQALKTVERLEYALNNVKESLRGGYWRHNPFGHPNVVTVGDFIIIDLHPDLSQEGAP